MRDKAHGARGSSEAGRAGSLRGRIVEYIAGQGGEVRSESGQGLRRHISDALAERPTRVGQALIALERDGLLEREMDLERHRCQAVRLVSWRSRPPPAPPHQRTGVLAQDGSLAHLVTDRARHRAELEAAEEELNDLIRRAAQASRRVGELRWALLQVNDEEPVPARSTTTSEARHRHG